MRWGLFVGLSLAAVGLVSSQSPRAPQPVGDRWLHDFTNEDGSHPDGRDPARDDSAALQRAMDAGPGVVRIGPGTYRIQNATMPHGVTVIGTGEGTVLQAHGQQPVFRQMNVKGWRLRDVCLQGEAVGDWTKRTDAGAHGLIVSGCSGYEISGVRLREFDGAGLQLVHTNLSGAGFADGGMLSRIVAERNWIGIRFDTRAEYITATQLDCHHNLTGIVIHAGNTNISASNFDDNRDGILLEDHENGSHGCLTNCLANHNQRYALWAKNVKYGMAISNCGFFYGTIRIENSQGVNLTSSLISASMMTEGPKANRVAGNHLLPEKFSFQFAPATIVEENFTSDGPWEPTPP